MANYGYYSHDDDDGDDEDGEEDEYEDEDEDKKPVAGTTFMDKDLSDFGPGADDSGSCTMGKALKFFAAPSSASNLQCARADHLASWALHLPVSRLEKACDPGICLKPFIQTYKTG